MILGDRVMMNGSGRGNLEFGEVGQQAFAFVDRMGRLAARIDDPFYGDLRIYQITYDRPNQTPNPQVSQPYRHP
jgi:hypothetical protein